MSPLLQPYTELYISFYRLIQADMKRKTNEELYALRKAYKRTQLSGCSAATSRVGELVAAAALAESKDRSKKRKKEKDMMHCLNGDEHQRCP